MAGRALQYILDQDLFPLMFWDFPLFEVLNEMLGAVLPWLRGVDLVEYSVMVASLEVAKATYKPSSGQYLAWSFMAYLETSPQVVLLIRPAVRKFAEFMVAKENSSPMWHWAANDMSLIDAHMKVFESVDAPNPLNQWYQYAYSSTKYEEWVKDVSWVFCLFRGQSSETSISLSHRNEMRTLPTTENLLRGWITWLSPIWRRKVRQLQSLSKNCL